MRNTKKIQTPLYQMMDNTALNKKNNLIEVLYEDDYYIVFNKPAGLLVIPTPKKEKRTLDSIVNEQYAAPERSSNLHPCHRLDRDTSGVIVFAKGKSAQRLMMDVFKQRGINKKYVAFVRGVLKRDNGEIKRAVNDLDHRKFNKNSAAKLAITRYKVIERKDKFTVVDVELVTGRTNQIRIHFSQIGYPLIGERKYAKGSDCTVKFKRIALHASSLECINPVTKKKITVRAELPQDMKKIMNI